MGDFNSFNQKAGDSINLAELGDKPFTITKVESSPYVNGEEETEGVKITTEENWEKADGQKVNKIHTTRKAIVSMLLSEDFQSALAKGETFKVKCPAEKVKSKSGGMGYYTLVAAE